MSDEFKIIAKRIKELREICGYEVSDMTKLLGIDEEKYLAYEDHGEDIPISVIYKIANEFRVDFSEILTGRSPRLNTYCAIKKGQGINADRYPGYHFESLGYKFKNRFMEPMLVTVAPDNRDHKLVVHDGQEFNYVLEGTILVEIGDESVILNEGDSIYFDSTLPHGQQALNGKEAKFLTIIAEKI